MNYRVLLVCMGNICRSPTAEVVLRVFIKNNNLGGIVEVDSAGTHGYHVGEAPDGGTQGLLLCVATICLRFVRAKLPGKTWTIST